MVNKEVRSLTGIRGIAALYVVFYHYFDSRINDVPDSFLIKFISHGYLSVDLFFILSGYLMTMTSGSKFLKINFSDYSLFMKKRFSRIYPLYIIILLFAFLTIGRSHVSAFVFSVFLLSTAFYQKGQVLEPLWSLSAEWIVYLVFPFIMFFCLKLPRKLLIILLPVVSLTVLGLISYKLKKLGYVRTLNIVSINGLSRCVADYFLGIAAFFVPGKIRSLLESNYIQSLITILLLVSLCFLYTDVLVVFLTALLILSISSDKGLINKFLSSRIIYYLGLISYSVYLIHYFFIYTPFFHTITFSVNGIIIRIAAVIASILVSMFTYKYIEIPGLKYFRRKLNC